MTLTLKCGTAVLIVLVLTLSATACGGGATRSPEARSRGVAIRVKTLTLTRSYRSPLGWSIRFPRTMRLEHSAASGISFAVSEATVASFPIRHGVRRHATPSSLTIRVVPPRSRLGRFPARGIAVRVLWLLSLGRIPGPAATQLPLRLSSFRRTHGDWYPGTRPRPLQHVFVANRRRYLVQVWIGPKASARSRTLLARIVASLSNVPVRTS
jgi:hypothetical protein